MIQDQHIWQGWADRLYRWGMQEMVAAFLEAIGPLNLLGAQIIYVGQPLLDLVLPESHLNALADLLENPEETRAFTKFLRQNNPRKEDSQVQSSK